MVKLLIDKGANINAKNDYYKTPLYYAICIKENIESVKLLIDKGGNLNIIGYNNETPLHYAVEIIENKEII